VWLRKFTSIRHDVSLVQVSLANRRPLATALLTVIDRSVMSHALKRRSSQPQQQRRYSSFLRLVLESLGDGAAAATFHTARPFGLQISSPPKNSKTSRLSSKTKSPVYLYLAHRFSRGSLQVVRDAGKAKTRAGQAVIP
jgi:hypothetical protein